MVAADRRRARDGPNPTGTFRLESGRDRQCHGPEPAGSPPRISRATPSVVDRRAVAVQRQEVERFLWQGRFGLAPQDLWVVAPHLSVVDSYLSGTQTRIGLTPRGWIDGVDFNRVAKLEELAPDALKRLQAVDRETFRTRGVPGMDQGPDPGPRSRPEAFH